MSLESNLVAFRKESHLFGCEDTFFLQFFYDVIYIYVKLKNDDRDTGICY